MCMAHGGRMRRAAKRSALEMQGRKVLCRTNLMPDDRRSLGDAAEPCCSTRLPRLSRCWRSGSGSSRSCSTRSSARWPRTTTRGKLPLPAPRGVLFDRNGTVLVENQQHLQHRARARADADVDATLQLLAAATGVDEAQLRDTVERRRREPTYRPIVLIENATPRAGDRRLGAPLGDARHHLPGSAVAAVPGQRHGGAPVRIRQRGHRGGAAARRTTRASSRARSSGRRASSRRTTRC